MLRCVCPAGAGGPAAATLRSWLRCLSAPPSAAASRCSACRPGSSSCSPCSTASPRSRPIARPSGVRLPRIISAPSSSRPSIRRCCGSLSAPSSRRSRFRPSRPTMPAPGAARRPRSSTSIGSGRSSGAAGSRSPASRLRPRGPPRRRLSLPIPPMMWRVVASIRSASTRPAAGGARSRAGREIDRCRLSRPPEPGLPTTASAAASVFASVGRGTCREVSSATAANGAEDGADPPSLDRRGHQARRAPSRTVGLSREAGCNKRPFGGTDPRREIVSPETRTFYLPATKKTCRLNPPDSASASKAAVSLTARRYAQSPCWQLDTETSPSSDGASSSRRSRAGRGLGPPAFFGVGSAAGRGAARSRAVSLAGANEIRENRRTHLEMGYGMGNIAPTPTP